MKYIVKAELTEPAQGFTKGRHLTEEGAVWGKWQHHS